MEIRRIRSTSFLNRLGAVLLLLYIFITLFCIFHMKKDSKEGLRRASGIPELAVGGDNRSPRGVGWLTAPVHAWIVLGVAFAGWSTFCSQDFHVTAVARIMYL